MLTTEQAETLRARYERFNAWVDTIRDKRSGWASYHPDDVPAELRGVALSNEETRELELFEFERDAPEHLFCYVTRRDGAWQCGTFAGGSYGRVTVGYSYKVPGFYCRPSTRRSVTLHAINGWIYAGTFYESAGDYARLRRTLKRWKD